MGTTLVADRTAVAISRYDEHARHYQETLRRRRPVADLRRFGSYTRRGDLVLDVACGPANDMRLLRDLGVHPVGVDMSLGALTEARMLLPRHPLVQAPIQDLPFKPRSFGGLWMSGSFNHLPREEWIPTLRGLMRLLNRGPVWFTCLRGDRDLEIADDPILGAIPTSSMPEVDVASMFQGFGLSDMQVELRPDPILDRKRPWVSVLGHLR